MGVASRLTSCRCVRWAILRFSRSGGPGTSTPSGPRLLHQEWVMSMSSPSTTTASDLDVLRARVAEELAGRLPRHIERLSWDADRLADHQRQRLRVLLAHALERSPFHA